MNPRLLKFALFVVGFATLAFLVERQHAATAALRGKAGRMHAEQAELARLRTEHEALEAQRLSPDALSQLREDQAEAARLRAEAASLRSKKPAQSAAAEIDRPPQPAAPKPATTAWSNAGRATPDTTFATGVWAALHGETDTLANLITFDAAGQALVNDQFARLPADTRATYGSAEKVFATLLAVRLPQDLASAEPVARKEEGPDNVIVHMRLTRTDASTKESDFRFTRAVDGWRIVVPTSVVKNYQQMLPGTSPASLLK